MIKPFLILDLDGTVLDDRKEIYEGFLDVLPRLRDMFEVVVASGRAKYSVENYLKRMGLPKRYVSFEGAYVVWDGHTVYQKPFEGKVLKAILGEYGGLPHVLFYLHRVEPSESFLREFRSYLERWGVDRVGKEGTGVYKVVLAKRGKPEDIPAERIPGTVFVYRRKGTDHVFWDIAPPGTGKTKGVRILLRRLGVDPRACVVVGDYYNDVGLFRMCGLSVASPNSPEDVKAEADTVGWLWDVEVYRRIEGFYVEVKKHLRFQV